MDILAAPAAAKRAGELATAGLQETAELRESHARALMHTEQLRQAHATSIHGVRNDLTAAVAAAGEGAAAVRLATRLG